MSLAIQSLLSKSNYELPLLELLSSPTLSFEEITMQVFEFQSHSNKTYREYIEYLGKNVKSILTVEDIPFMPISCFKRHDIKSGDWPTETTFLSSGTTGTERSQHSIRSGAFYQQWSMHIFQSFFGQLSSDWTLLALLPNYIEQGQSSLVYMVDHFKNQCSAQSGFYLNDLRSLSNHVDNAAADGKRLVIFGVSYALLDFAAVHKNQLPTDSIVIETGGMKGKRKELTRAALHQKLSQHWQIPIYSEYGMTELLSQAYTDGTERFRCPPSMRIMVSEMHDPNTLVANGKTGKLNIIDLANLHSCAFIATDDLGKVHDDSSFEVLGRHDLSEARGCNLMVD